MKKKQSSSIDAIIERIGEDKDLTLWIENSKIRTESSNKELRENITFRKFQNEKISSKRVQKKAYIPWTLLIGPTTNKPFRNWDHDWDDKQKN